MAYLKSLQYSILLELKSISKSNYRMTDIFTTIVEATTPEVHTSTGSTFFKVLELTESSTNSLVEVLRRKFIVLRRKFIEITLVVKEDALLQEAMDFEKSTIVIENCNFLKEKLQEMLQPFGFVNGIQFFQSRNRNYGQVTMQQEKDAITLLKYSRHMFSEDGSLLFCSPSKKSGEEAWTTIMAKKFPVWATEKKIEELLRGIKVE